jgi:predicted nucleic acid-binding protein
MIIVDTCVISRYWEDEAPPPLVERFEQCLEVEEAAISAVTEYELRRGLMLSAFSNRDAHKRRLFDQFLREVPIVPLEGNGLRVWQIAASIWARRAAVGRIPGEADILVAATAIAHKYRLLTCDEKLHDGLSALGYKNVELILPR